MRISWQTMPKVSSRQMESPKNVQFFSCFSFQAMNQPQILMEKVIEDGTRPRSEHGCTTIIGWIRVPSSKSSCRSGSVTNIARKKQREKEWQIVTDNILYMYKHCTYKYQTCKWYQMIPNVLSEGRLGFWICFCVFLANLGITCSPISKGEHPIRPSMEEMIKKEQLDEFWFPLIQGGFPWF